MSVKSSPAPIRIKPRDAKLEIAFEHQGTSKVAFTAFYGDPGKRRLAGITDFGPGTINIPFSYDEMMYILAGRATVTPEGGQPFEVGPGDTLYWPRGSAADWDIKETVRDVWCVMSDVPLEEEWVAWFGASATH